MPTTSSATSASAPFMPESDKRRVGAIDIGTNAIRLLIADGSSKKPGKLAEKLAVRVPLRLGKPVFATGAIGDATGARLAHTMQGFGSLAAALEVSLLRACATSAFRDASDWQQRARLAAQALGSDIEVIDGIEEARLMSLSARQATTGQLAALIDVGGGSTEISIVDHERTLAAQTFKLGTVRLIGSDGLKEEFARMRAWVLAAAAERQPRCLLGSGGNIRHIHRMCGTGRPLTIAALQGLAGCLNALTVAQRIDKYAMRPDRADTITGALDIFMATMEAFAIDSIAVRPNVGLAEGIAISLLAAAGEKK